MDTNTNFVAVNTINKNGKNVLLAFDNVEDVKSHAIARPSAKINIDEIMYIKNGCDYNGYRCERRGCVAYWGADAKKLLEQERVSRKACEAVADLIFKNRGM